MEKTKDRSRRQSQQEEKKFRLQLDYKTIIIVKGKEALQRWLSRFPEAKLLKG